MTSTESELRDAAHDAFMAFWRATDGDSSEALWLAYCAAQEQYEASVMDTRALEAMQALGETGASL